MVAMASGPVVCVLGVLITSHQMGEPRLSGREVGNKVRRAGGRL